ncbi:hypothetical protein CLV63_13231 [Murinocardiopsis flavida]|uniref:Uncharacterized protein n=1 Tax=Murinocardiopsis flavida TaxID=645275 RepID=A0A2P8CQZ9_9ACTN|nr:hypothetical protein [Murinocardiopsis flavida]PSK87376.1 hypothetical protein CLV63_13231 [Murinocardiopsis flavida]
MNTALIVALAADDAPLKESVTPGVLGFITIALIATALYFLMKSMRRRMASIDFDEGLDEGSDTPRPAAAADRSEE